MRFLARRLLLVVYNGGHRGAKLEIAQRVGRFRQLLQFALDEAGVDGVGAHVRVRNQRRQERDVGDDAPDISLFQPAVEPLDGGLPRRRPGDHFCQHGIVIRRHRIAIAIAGVNPQAIDGVRRAPGLDPAHRRHEILLRIFGIDPRLDGVAVQSDLVLRQRQLFAERHAQLPFDQIDAGNQLGHGMLDLQAGVHLDEEHLLAVGDEFDGAGADIVHGGGRLARGGADRFALLGVQRRRRRFLDHLLVSPLQRAFALPEREQIAMAVADDLHLDMPGVLHEFFDQHAVVAECGLGLALGTDDGRRKLCGRIHRAHAPPAATR